MNLKPMFLGVFAFFALESAVPAFADSIAVTVLGTANPYLAGQPGGTNCCGGDTAPGGSPTYVPATVTPGSTLTFSGSGGFNYGGGAPASSLDGDNNGVSLTYIYNQTGDYGTGIAGALGVNVDGLVGVFLTAAQPSGPAPSQLDYNALGLDAASYAPGLNQIFWIGDGLTGLGSGSVQTFVVPTGASRLFLGMVDGCCWYNNSGVASVTVTGVTLGSGVPEPSTWALMLTGFVGLGLASRRAARRVAKVA
jgi:hypothetical protein